MGRTNLDIDDDLINAVMARYRVTTKREAVEYALRSVQREVFSPEQIMALAGTGFWDGDPHAAELDPAEFPDLFTDGARTASSPRTPA